MDSRLPQEHIHFLKMDIMIRMNKIRLEVISDLLAQTAGDESREDGLDSTALNEKYIRWIPLACFPLIKRQFFQN